MADRPYSRVYYVDLERDYPTVWRDDALLSTYVRMLSIAEAMWPSIPEVPRAVRPGNVQRLVSSSLVELVQPFGYRIKGMNAERTARSNAARIAASIRWGNANGHAHAMPNQTEPNRTEPTRAKRTNGEARTVDEREWTPEQERAAYVERQARATGVKS